MRDRQGRKKGMLRNIELKEKSYEQMLREAIAQISVYGSGWTNYNASDPGITILENLTAFSVLQQSETGKITDEVKWKLLGLAGFKAEKGRAAQTYISDAVQDTELPHIIPSGQKLFAHDICFEPDRNGNLDNARILRIEAKQGGAAENLDALLDSRGISGGVELFGNSPSGGEEVFLYLDRVPGQGQDLIIYFEITEQYKRNPFPSKEEGYENPFAKIKWELFTSGGGMELAADDGTECFLQSGYVRMKMPRCASKDCVLRIRVEQAAYDIAPRIQRVSGLLTRVVQKDTKSAVIELCTDGKKEVMLCHSILENGFIELYGIQADGLYHRIDHEAKLLDNAQQRLVFGGAIPKQIMAVCREKSVMAYSNLGVLYGYDDQVMQLPPLRYVYGAQFSILVVEMCGNRKGICHEVMPEAADPQEVRYSLREEENVIVIHDCGVYEGAQVRLGAYALYNGSGGNVLPGTQFILKCGERKRTFINCPGGESGCFPEKAEQARKRFAKDLRMPVTMVTKEDCRRIVKGIPGLSIHKAGVSIVPERNEIHVVIKPNSTQEHPRLSELYIHEAQKYLDKYRMLTTNIIIEQPVYVAINIQGVIYVKKHYDRCQKAVEQVFRRLLNGVQSDAEFGSRIFFHDIYESFLHMDCVEEIGELSVYPEDSRHCSRVGLDIQMAENALYYPGECFIEIESRI